MSRVGKRPIELPEGVEVRMDNSRVQIKGPKGVLTHHLPPSVGLQRGDKLLLVVNQSSSREADAIYGLTRTLLYNMVKGVSEGFEKRLEIKGIGYRALMQGQTLVLYVGYSHPIQYQPPEGTWLEVSGRSEVIVKGIDKQLVGLVAAKIRSFRPPEPYKGKGVLYAREKVRRKAGKAGTQKG